LVALTSVPPGLNQDEAVTGYDAWSIWQTGHDHLGHFLPLVAFETFGDWSSPLLTYLMVPAVAGFGPHVIVLRAVSAVAGAAAIPLVYLLANELFRRGTAAVIAAWIVAVSLWFVHISRWAVSPAIVPAVLSLAMYLFARSLRASSARGIVMSAAAAGLAVASYHSMKVYVPLLAVVGVAAFFPYVRLIKWPALVAALAVFIAIAGPILYQTWRDPVVRARVDQTSVFEYEDVTPTLLVRHYLAYFSPGFLWGHGDGAATLSPARHGIDLRGSAPFVVIGAIWLMSQWRRPRDEASRFRRSSALFLAAAVMLYPVPGTVTVPNPHALRAVAAVPLLAICGALGAVATGEAAARLLRCRGATAVRRIGAPIVAFAVAGAVVVLAGWEIAGHYHSYFRGYAATVAPDFQFGLDTAVAFARDHESDYDEIWITDAAEPYIYVLFADRWSPSDVQARLVVHRAPPASNWVSEFGKYRFESLPPGVDPLTMTVVKEIDEPDGTVAFRIRAGVDPRGERILLISKH